MARTRSRGLVRKAKPPWGTIRSHERSGHQTPPAAPPPLAHSIPPTNHGAIGLWGEGAGFNSRRGSCNSSATRHRSTTHPQQHQRDNPSTNNNSNRSRACSRQSGCSTVLSTARLTRQVSSELAAASQRVRGILGDLAMGTLNRVRIDLGHVGIICSNHTYSIAASSHTTLSCCSEVPVSNPSGKRAESLVPVAASVKLVQPAGEDGLHHKIRPGVLVEASGISETASTLPPKRRLRGKQAVTRSDGQLVQPKLVQLPQEVVPEQVSGKRRRAGAFPKPACETCAREESWDTAIGPAHLNGLCTVISCRTISRDI